MYKVMLSNRPVKVDFLVNDLRETNILVEIKLINGLMLKTWQLALFVMQLNGN